MTQRRKRLLTKIIVIVVCGAALLLGGGMVEQMEATKRGIVIGTSIDKTDEGFTVCAQLVVAGESNTPGSASAYEVVVGEGKTLMQAMENITTKSSLRPSYAHCKVLFVGEQLIKGGLDEVMVTLLESNSLGSDMQVVAVQGRAQEAIGTPVAILTTSSSYLEQDSELVTKVGGRSLVTIKDYCQRLDGKGGTKYLPLAVKIKAEPPLGAEQQGTQDVYLFDLNNTVAYDQNGTPHFYGHEVTQGVGLVEAKGGEFTATLPDGRFVTVRIDKVYRTRHYRPDTVVGNYRYEVSVVEQTLVPDGQPSSKEVAQLVAEQIDARMEDVYRKCKQDGVDIFSACGRVYKRYWKWLPLDQVKWERHVSVVVR